MRGFDYGRNGQVSFSLSEEFYYTLVLGRITEELLYIGNIMKTYEHGEARQNSLLDTTGKIS